MRKPPEVLPDDHSWARDAAGYEHFYLVGRLAPKAKYD
jgi:hypothetical protein